MHRTPTIEGNGSHTVNLLQFLAWIAAQPHTYAEMMIDWRTPALGSRVGKMRSWASAIVADANPRKNGH